MSCSSPYSHSATEAIRLVRVGDLSPTEWVTSCLERISSVDSEVEAWAHLDPEQGLAQARELEDRIREGQDLFPLFGVPIGIKDVFNTHDMPTRRGSRVYEGYRPRNDARVVARLRWSNATILGKTSCDEFAVHWPAPTKNPHNPAHTPGGSSSGSASAVAAGMIPLALSSQTLGSTVRPSSYCGIYGFKPTFGMLPRTGMLKTTDTLDHVALMTRSIEDTRLFFETTRLSGDNHPFIHERVDKRIATSSLDRKWRVGVLAPPGWAQEEPYAAAALARFSAKLSETGSQVRRIHLPPDFEEVPRIHDTIYDVMLSYYFKEEYNDHRDEISDWFAEMVERGLAISTDDYVAALRRQEDLERQFEDTLASQDVLLTLSSSGEAPEGRFSRTPPDTCLIWTLCRGPALSVPAFRGPSGLPFGLQVVAKRYDDFELLDFVAFLKSRELVADAEIANVSVVT